MKRRDRVGRKDEPTVRNQFHHPDGWVVKRGGHEIAAAPLNEEEEISSLLLLGRKDDVDAPRKILDGVLEIDFRRIDDRGEICCGGVSQRDLISSIQDFGGNEYRANMTVSVKFCVQTKRVSHVLNALLHCRCFYQRKDTVFSGDTLILLV